tara:strand:- start:12324 stop:13331 length:1008 start_codon:yes stop_codon:yes gene_type:complete
MDWSVKTKPNQHSENNSDGPLSELLSAVETKLRNEHRNLDLSHRTKAKEAEEKYNAALILLNEESNATISSLQTRHSNEIKQLEKYTSKITVEHKVQLEKSRLTNDQLKTCIHAYNVVLDNYKTHVCQSEINSKRVLQQKLDKSNSCNASLKVQIDILKLGRKLGVKAQTKPLEAEIDVLAKALRLAQEKAEAFRLLAERQTEEIEQMTKEANSTQLNICVSKRKQEQETDRLVTALQVTKEKLEKSIVQIENRDIKIEQMTKEINNKQLNALVSKREQESEIVQAYDKGKHCANKEINKLKSDVLSLEAQLETTDALLRESRNDLVMIARESLG